LSEGWSPFCGHGGGSDDLKAILEPLIVDSVTEVFKKHRLNAQVASQNLVDEEFADMVIVARNRFCK
jgi:hypothetical protein